MKRWHQDEKITRREWRKHRRTHVEQNKDNSNLGIGKSPFVVECACDDQIGRFRKKDAYDCGKAGCMICASHKFPKREKTNGEVLSEVVFKEQLEEL